MKKSLCLFSLLLCFQVGLVAADSELIKLNINDQDVEDVYIQDREIALKLVPSKASYFTEFSEKNVGKKISMNFNSIELFQIIIMVRIESDVIRAAKVSDEILAEAVRLQDKINSNAPTKAGGLEKVKHP
ncbi:MAG: hypothetical protein ACJAZP_001448 [Psychromonas sp.]|jgi:hypothetical protein|uniref:hypothetical protein n=1 Tax=Psychromonas sp. TaxID=1884585 RepID=UPI0039E41FA5